jgi:glycerol kinase
MNSALILAIDQGTSSTKTIIFNTKGEVVAKATVVLETHYLEGGFVEQDPEGIYQNVMLSVQSCLETFTANGGKVEDIKTAGISNQRETFVVWDKNGTAIAPAVVWQCKRSIAICKDLNSDIDLVNEVKRKTGLIIDPYFSATKLIWLLQNDEIVRHKIQSGKAFFGTVDTWLLYKLTKGAQYLTDYTNASRTLLFNLENLDWDQELIASMGLSGINLPDPKPSAYTFGESTFEGLFKTPLSITAMIGDSHAAAFGEGCLNPGTAKATLGTGCSVLMNIGGVPQISKSGMITTICWSTEERVDYALEGVIVSCGSTIEWLINELQLFGESQETEAMAASVLDNNGVYIIPAFSGLGAPYWDMSRKASIEGLTFDCTKNHIVRAALETIPFQIKAVLEAMQKDTGVMIEELMVNGGITANNFVMDFLADLIQSKVVKSRFPDVSALGASYLASIGKGIFKDLQDVQQLLSNKESLYSEKYKKSEEYYATWNQLINTRISNT